MSHPLFRVMVSVIAALALLPAAASARPNLTYLAFGDSYSSGPGVEPQRASVFSCMRSAKNYPALIAEQRRLGIPGAANGLWNDYSCAGASRQRFGQQVDEALAAGEIGPATAAISFSIGGNDRWPNGRRSLWETFTACVWFSSACQNDADVQKPSEISAVTYAEWLRPALSAVAAKAPDAKVLIVSYPSFVPRAGQPGCRDPWLRAWELTSAEAAFVDGLLVKTLAAQQGAAVALSASTGLDVRVVDTYTPSAGTSFCAPEALTWIQSPNPTAGQLHPNAQGMRRMAALTLATYDG